MAFEHARVCGSCERDFPGWADRCPCCGSRSVVHRVVITPAGSSVAEIARPKWGRKKNLKTPANGVAEVAAS